MTDAAPRGASLALPRGLLLAISFSGGFQIMVLEICGFRVLQTNLGSSVGVAGTLLTLIMVLLSAGYYTGGLLSERWQRSARGLLSLLLGAALYSALLGGPLLEPVASLGWAVREALAGQVYLQSIVPSVLLTLLLYGPPVFVMSMISPYLIRSSSSAGSGSSSGERGAAAGVEAGFFMSLSTVGSIAGTMLSSYLSVPLVGVQLTALATSTAFFALVAVAWWRAGSALPPARRVRGRSLLAVAVVVLVLCGFHRPERDPNLVYRAESHYGDLEVYKGEDSVGRSLLTYHPSRVYMHSMLYPGEPLRDMEGNIYFIPGLVRAPERVLVLGSAAGGALRGLALAFPRAHLTGVDLDPKVHEVATQVFGVDPARTALVTADARMFLSETQASYDFVIVDLFAGEFIPSHCISVEFFELLRQRLSPSGSVFINTNMNDVPFELGGGAQPFRAIRHLAATLRAAGFDDLIENPFFNSIFAFRGAMPIEKFRAALEREWQNSARSAPLRAAAGLALYTSFAVAPDRERYRPFSDAWTPGFLIELKSNPSALYAALEEEGMARVLAQSPSRGAPAALLERVLARHFAEWRGSTPQGLVDVPALVRALGEVPDPLGPSALDVGARFLQFTGEASELEAQPASAWAELADLYGRLHALGHANDYEGLLGVLERVRHRLEAP